MKGVAIELGLERVTVSVMVRRRGRWHAQHRVQRQVPAWANAVVSSDGLGRVLADLSAELDLPRYRVAVAVPASCCRFRVISIALTGSQAIRKVIKYEAEAAFPDLNIEEQLVHHRIISRGEDLSQVLVTVMPHRVISRAVAALAEARIEPAVIDLDVNASLAALSAMKGQATGSGLSVFIHRASNTYNVGMFDNGRLISVRSLTCAADQDVEAEVRSLQDVVRSSVLNAAVPCPAHIWLSAVSEETAKQLKPLCEPAEVSLVGDVLVAAGLGARLSGHDLYGAELGVLGGLTEPVASRVHRPITVAAILLFAIVLVLCYRGRHLHAAAQRDCASVEMQALAIAERALGPNDAGLADARSLPLGERAAGVSTALSKSHSLLSPEDDQRSALEIWRIVADGITKRSGRRARLLTLTRMEINQQELLLEGSVASQADEQDLWQAVLSLTRDNPELFEKAHHQVTPVPGEQTRRFLYRIELRRAE